MKKYFLFSQKTSKYLGFLTREDDAQAQPNATLIEPTVPLNTAVWTGTEWITPPPPPVRYATKKIIEKMVAENIIGAIRNALITANMYEILLLEPVLSMDDPRLTAALEIITPIAAALEIHDITAWLEPCKI